MIVGAEEIARLARGCGRVEHRDGAVRFHRLPAGLEEAFGARESGRVRAGCTSGVRLRFVSDAKRLWLGLRFGPAAREFRRGVLVRNGTHSAVFGPSDEAPAWEGELPGVPSQVMAPGVFDLWLPHLVQAEVTRLELCGGVLVGYEPRCRGRWLILGGSIAQGMTAPLPTETWYARIAQSLGLDVWNLGIGGAPLEPFLLDSLVDWPFDLLSIHFGGNDWSQGRPPSDQALLLRQVVESYLASRPSGRILVITPTPRLRMRTPLNALGLDLRAYRDAAIQACEGLSRVRVVQGDGLLDTEPELFADDVHPNAEGMRMLADRLMPHVKEMLP